MIGDTTPAVGIDLGTTYSAVAYIDDTGRAITLVNAEGDLVTPSVVLFEGPLCRRVVNDYFQLLFLFRHLFGSFSPPVARWRSWLQSTPSLNEMK